MSDKVGSALKSLVNSTRTASTVGSFDPNDEESIGQLARMAAQGEFGRQGPERQAQAEQTRAAQFQSDSMDLARTGSLRTPSPVRIPFQVGQNPGGSAARSRTTGEPIAPPDPNLFLGAGQRTPEAQQSVEEIILESLFTGGDFAFDPANPKGSSEELAFRDELADILINRLKTQRDAEQEAKLAPFRLAQEFGLDVNQADLAEILGITLQSDLEPELDPNSVEGQAQAEMEAGLEQEIINSRIAREADASGAPVQSISVLEGLGNLGFGPDSGDTGLSFGNLDENTANIRGVTGSLLRAFTPFNNVFGGGAQDQIVDTQSEAVQRILADPRMDAFMDELKVAVANPNISAQDLNNDLLRLRELADAAGDPLPDGFVDVARQAMVAALEPTRLQRQAAQGR